MAIRPAETFDSKTIMPVSDRAFRLNVAPATAAGKHPKVVQRKRRMERPGGAARAHEDGQWNQEIHHDARTEQEEFPVRPMPGRYGTRHRVLQKSPLSTEQVPPVENHERPGPEKPLPKRGVQGLSPREQLTQFRPVVDKESH